MGYRLLHWGPMVALSIIFSISITTIACHMEWWPLHTMGAFANMTVFLTWNGLTLFNFFRAAFRGPGLVPEGWTPTVAADKKSLQFCNICESYKVPRSHHCRKCRRCVMKMDHHCPWINNCVGHFNHANFVAFLFFAPCGCIHALCVLLPSLYRAIYRHCIVKRLEPSVWISLPTVRLSIAQSCLGLGFSLSLTVLLLLQNYYVFYGTGREPLVDLGVASLIGAMLSVGLAFGVVLAVGGLLVMQMRSIIKNETGIETWIKDKAEYRDREEDEEDFVFPYNLGRWKNLRMVLHWKTRPELNGIWWPVREGCHQYTLTEEQIKQKKEKRSRSVLYQIIRPFSGSLCPITFGLRVCCCPPCMDEQRVRLRVGERILVSRFRKNWLYGDKVYRVESQMNSKEKRERGWFPRKCGTRLSAGHGDMLLERQFLSENSSNEKPPHLNDNTCNENCEHLDGRTNKKSD